MTQKQRILQALRNHPDGLPIWKIVTPRPQGGLGVLQYGARILELRREGHNIKNKDYKFFLTEYKQEENGQYKFI